jgi:hypothetical protein
MTLARAHTEKQGRDAVVKPAGADADLASKALSLRDKVGASAAVYPTPRASVTSVAHPLRSARS